MIVFISVLGIYVRYYVWALAEAIVVSCGMLYIPHNNDDHHANVMPNLHILAFPGAYINSPDKICSCRDQCTMLLYKVEKWHAKTLLPILSSIMLTME